MSMMVNADNADNRVNVEETRPRNDDVPPIYAQMREMDGRLDSLHASIASLTDRLNPVMVPAPTRGDVSDVHKDPYTPSEVTETLRRFNSAIERAIYHLDVIHEQLEL